MKRSIKYFVAICIVFICIYGFWWWLQYKWGQKIRQTTDAIATQLILLQKLETARIPFHKTITWEQELASLVPTIGVEELINNVLFKSAMILDVEWYISAGYIFDGIDTWDIQVSRDGTVRIILWKPHILDIQLTWALPSIKTGNIITKKDRDMEQQLKAKASELIVQDILSWTLFQDTKTNAQKLLQTLFLKANIQIKEVIITWISDID